VGALILTTSARELAGATGLGAVRWALYAAIAALVALAAATPHVRRRARAPQPATAATPATATADGRPPEPEIPAAQP
jgi:hypothetical protein